MLLCRYVASVNQALGITYIIKNNCFTRLPTEGPILELHNLPNKLTQTNAF